MCFILPPIATSKQWNDVLFMKLGPSEAFRGHSLIKDICIVWVEKDILVPIKVVKFKSWIITFTFTASTIFYIYLHIST